MKPENNTLENNPRVDNPNNQIVSPKQKGYLLPILGVILLTLIIGTGAYYFGTLKNNKSEQTLPSTVAQNTAPTKSSEEVPGTPARSPATAFDETTNWKIYSNLAYGVTLKYPSEWSVFEDTQYKKIKLLSEYPRSVDHSVRLEIATYMYDGKTPIEDWWNKNLKASSVGTPAGTTTINGLPALKVTGQGETPFAVYYIPVKNTVYEVSIDEISSSDMANNVKKANQVLQTVTFSE
ncbi:MAG: hypothetical protein M1150_03300 [Patescibacteria group bacterium]|nr:hypothetical protein [Patescibacteria group bacterium]